MSSTGLSAVNTIKERLNEFENGSIEITQIEAQRKEKVKRERTQH